MNPIKVSIIIPIYNVEKYLKECIDSVVNQTLEEIEIICVDDGSTDSSLDIIKKCSDERIICISKENAGYGHSMNVGLSVAKGDYIGIVEPDDYIERDMFETLYNCAIENDCTIVKSDYYEFTTSTKKKQQRIQTPTDKKYYNLVLNAHSCPEIFHFKMNTWTGIYKTDFIRSNSIVYNETPGAAYQDNGFWFQTLALSDSIMFINRSFYHYRQDNPNSSINSKAKVFCMCDEYAFIERFINDNKISNEYFGIFLIKKYCNYMYTYKRISDEYKMSFLIRMKEEFEPYLKTSENAEKELGSHIFNMLWRIVDDPQQFYVEDTIYEIQHNIVAHSLWLDHYHKITHPLHR